MLTFEDLEGPVNRIFTQNSLLLGEKWWQARSFTLSYQERGQDSLDDRYHPNSLQEGNLSPAPQSPLGHLPELLLLLNSHNSTKSLIQLPANMIWPIPTHTVDLYQNKFFTVQTEVFHFCSFSPKVSYCYLGRGEWMFFGHFIKLTGSNRHTQDINKTTSWSSEYQNVDRT